MNTITMINIEEQFEPMKGYEHRYLVSNMGRVIDTLTDQATKQYKIGKRRVYLGCNVKDKQDNWQTVAVHRVVAEHFVEGFQPGLQVDHIDAATEHYCCNEARNLRWVTPKENINRACELTGFTRKITPYMIDCIRDQYAAGVGLRDISVDAPGRYGVSISYDTVRKIVNREGRFREVAA